MRAFQVRGQRICTLRFQRLSIELEERMRGLLSSYNGMPWFFGRDPGGAVAVCELTNLAGGLTTRRPVTTTIDYEYISIRFHQLEQNECTG